MLVTDHNGYHLEAGGVGAAGAGSLESALAVSLYKAIWYQGLWCEGKAHSHLSRSLV